MQQGGFDFAEDIYDALRSIVLALGGYKAVGCRLWPHLDPDTALTKMRDSLNRERAQKLDMEEMLWLLLEGRKAEIHTGMYFIADYCKYERPRTKSLEQRREELQRMVVDAVSRLSDIQAQLTALQED